MKTASALLLGLALTVPACAAEVSAPRPGAPARNPPAASQPATEIVGFISPIQGAGICMDGATHLIHSANGDFRLKAANPQAAKDLAKVASGEERATLSGHRVNGAECVYFSVEHVTRSVHD